MNEKHQRGEKLKHQRNIVSAGPWRMYDFDLEDSSDDLRIDFYSVCRYRGGPGDVSSILQAL